MRKHTINDFLRTGFTNNGRAAGIGISEDDYSDTSYADHSSGAVRPYRQRKCKLQQPKEAREEYPVKTYFLNDISK